MKEVFIMDTREILQKAIEAKKDMAIELTNVGCNYLREHIPQDTRVHYAYENAGGPANNIVQDHCVLSYGVHEGVGKSCAARGCKERAAGSDRRCIPLSDGRGDV